MGAAHRFCVLSCLQYNYIRPRNHKSKVCEIKTQISHNSNKYLITSNQRQIKCGAESSSSPSDSRLIAIVGDVHNSWDEKDNIAVRALNADLVVFVGDFGNEDIHVVSQVAACNVKKVSIFGNHDAWSTLRSQKQRPFRGVEQQIELLKNCSVGYSSMPFDKVNLSVVGGRPFSEGGGATSPYATWKKVSSFYSQLYGVKSFKHSASKITQALHRATKDRPDHDVILLAHNGPSGLGSELLDICGKDFSDDGGDWGDPDLQQAVEEYLQNGGGGIKLVVFGHMHERVFRKADFKLSGTTSAQARFDQLRRRIEIKKRIGDSTEHRDSIVYLNCAVVPRVRSASDLLGYIQQHAEEVQAGPSAGVEQAVGGAVEWGQVEWGEEGVGEGGEAAVNTLLYDDSLYAGIQLDTFGGSGGAEGAGENDLFSVQEGEGVGQTSSWYDREWLDDDAVQGNNAVLGAGALQDEEGQGLVEQVGEGYVEGDKLEFGGGVAVGYQHDVYAAGVQHGLGTGVAAHVARRSIQQLVEEAPNCPCRHFTLVQMVGKHVHSVRDVWMLVGADKSPKNGNKARGDDVEIVWEKLLMQRSDMGEGTGYEMLEYWDNYAQTWVQQVEVIEKQPAGDGV